MFLRPSYSLHARIRALLGNHSFASSPDEIGPRGEVVTVLNRIRRMTLHHGISFLATRTAKLFVVVRVILKVYHPKVSRVVLHSCATTECVTVFYSEEKTLQTFPRRILSGICLLLRVSFIRNTSFSGSFCLLAKQRTACSRKALFFVAFCRNKEECVC